MKQATLALILGLSFLLSSSAQAKDKTPWSVDVVSGDVVCLYDIHPDDPLFKQIILKYLPKDSKYDNGKRYWEYELLPDYINMEFIVIHPGTSIQKDQDLTKAWYKAQVLVMAGSSNFHPRYSVINFEYARFKKKGKLLGCKRNY